MSTGPNAQLEIFASQPDDRRAFEAIEEKFFLDGNWEDLVNAYRLRIAAPTIAEDPEQLAPLLLRLGQVLEERVLDSAAASEIYWRLAKLDPKNRPALRQLRGIHEQQQQWDMVLQIAEIEGQTDMPPYERAAFEAELGGYWLDHLADSDEAEKSFKRSLAADPTFPAALQGLASVHKTAGQPVEAAALLDRLTDRLRGPERAPVWVELGVLCAGPLDDPIRAVACFERALDDDPFFVAAVEWLLLLETAAENWDSVSNLLETRFELAAGARHRAAIAVEASQIHLTHLGSNAAARAWVERAAELANDEVSVLLAQVDVDRADGDIENLRATLNRLITIGGRSVPRSELMLAAELHADLGQTEEALEVLRLAAEKSSENDFALLMLQARLFRESGAKRELAETLEILTELDGFDDPKRLAEALRELARIQEEDLGDETSAKQGWIRAFELDATQDEAVSALERIHRKSNDWDSLRLVFERATEVRRTTGEALLCAKLGGLLLDEFNDVPAARKHFEAAIAVDESCIAALSGLRRIADIGGDQNLLLSVCERQALLCQDTEEMASLATICVPILEERQAYDAALEWVRRWTQIAPQARQALEWRADLEALLELPEQEIESRRALGRIQEGHERIETLRRQADLHIQLDDVISASAALETALESEPEEVEILSTLADSYRSMGRSEKLAHCLRQWANVVPRDEQLAILEELADILHDPLGELNAAIVVRWRLVDHPGAPQEAAEKLEALLELTGRYTEMAQLLDARRATLGDNSPEALELDLRRARLRLDSLGQCEEAAEVLATLHERNPQDEVILAELERALRAGDDSQGLCDLLERRASWESDDDRRREIQLERAMLLDEVLGQPIEACDLYESVTREEAGTDHASFALARLETLLESNGQWQRLRSLLSERVEATRGEEQATLRERIAQICGERLGDLSGCAEQLEAIAQTTTDRVHVWQRLEEIYRHDLDRPADWLRVVEAELETGPEPDRELTLRVGAARLFLNEERRPHDRDAAEAFPHFESVLVTAPTHPEAAEALIRHYSETGQYAESVRVLEFQLANRGEEAHPEDLCGLRLQLAEILATRLEEPRLAQTHFEATREVLGPIPRISEALAEIYACTEQFESLAKLSREVLDATVSGSPSYVWRIRLAASDRALGHLDSASISYRTALLASPDDREIEDALIEIYEEQNEFEPLAELLEKRLSYAPFEEGIALRIRLARVQADGLDAPADGLEQLEAILELHPQHRDAFEFAMKLADRIGDPARLVSLLDRPLATELPSEERASLLEQRGILVAKGLGDPEQSLPCFREAIALSPSRESARLALREQLEDLERWPAVLDCLFVEASNCTQDRRIELLERAAEIAWTQIRPDAALPWVARLRKERPDDPSLLERLREIHRRAGRFEAALNTLDEEICMRPTEADACRLYVQRARILEQEIHAPGRAIVSYQQALTAALTREERDPILIELDRLYTSNDRPVERAAILEERAQNAEGLEGIGLRQTLATTYCVDLVKPHLAIAPLLINVDATRDDSVAQMGHLGALDAALRASARPDAWARVAEKELELIEFHENVQKSTPAEYQVFLREELARIYDVELGNPERAIAHLRKVVDLRGDSARAEVNLCDLLRRCGQLSELTTRLTDHLEQSGGPGTEWLELGRLREERIHDLEGAIAAYHEAAQDPDTSLDAIRGRRRCAERLRDFGAMAQALDAELEQTTPLSASERAALACKLGEVCWERLHDSERAAAAYEHALELEPRRLDAIQSLVAIRESGDDIGASLAMYRRELELLAHDESHHDRARQIWLRLAVGLQREPESARPSLEAYQAAGAIERLNAPDELKVSRLHEALDEPEAFCKVFGDWCDREDSNAGVSEHLELASHLVAAGRTRDARDRTKRATELDGSRPEPWIQLAELERENDQRDAAADAYERAAKVADLRWAAEYYVEAAACLEAGDLERAWTLLERAVSCDAGCLGAHIARLRLAAELGRDEVALPEAERVFELAQDHLLDDPIRLELALFAGRAATRLDDREARRHFFAIVVSVDADHVEGLEGIALADFEIGDYRSARLALEHRIEINADDPDLVQHLTMIARGLEADGLLDAASTRYEQAIEADPSFEDAQEGLVRVHERSARPSEALDCLERWAASGDNRGIRARAALRAGEHALALEDPDRARQNLEDATGLDPELAPAWLLLCQIVAERGPTSEARRLCAAALDFIEPGPISAQIALSDGKLAEQVGETNVARERYAEAARWEPRCVEAALSESRLARLAGDWVAAESILAHFLDAHPDAISPTLAHVYLERGRLLSGPLEGFDEAIRAYELALELQPELHVARTALAGLLSHSPDRWAQALAIHDQILANSPTNANSLRALTRIAEQRGKPDLGAAANAILHALGQAAPREVSEAEQSLQFPLHAGPPMNDSAGERLRRMAHALRDEVADVFSDVEERDFGSKNDAVSCVARQIQEIEAELTAPKFGALDAGQRASFFTTLAGLFLAPGGGGDSPYHESLNRALGRWTRRKVRRIAEETTLAEIAVIDHDAWGAELRALSAAQALDRNGGDLRSTLRALLLLETSSPDPDLFESLELGTFASSSDAAKRLLARITGLLCERLARGH